MCYRRDLADGDELLFVDRFKNDNYFADALHYSGIAGVAQYENDQDDDNDDDDSNMNEDSDNPPGISLKPAAARVEISGVSQPENPVEPPGVAPLGFLVGTP